MNLEIELNLHLDLKTTFSLQYGKSLSILCLSFVLRSSEIFAKYGKTEINLLLGTMKSSFFLVINPEMTANHFP